MAQRRMFSSKIVGSDAFLDMPISGQLLYFHLGMQADDDGFVGNPKRIMRMIGAGEDDFKILIAKRFILTFQSGVVVIKHWLIHNTIQGDRYHETQYQEEKKALIIKENKAYTELDTKRIQNVSILDTEVKLNKPNLTEVKLNKPNEREPPSLKIKDFFNNPSKQETIISILIEKGIPKNIALTEIHKFIAYWTEPNKSGTKQRWELQETFELNRRLITWFSKIKEFNPPKGGGSKTLIL